MRAINASRFSDSNLTSPSRIGDQKRKTGGDDFLKELETKIESKCPLPTTFDATPMHPPYFSEFVYHDMMGGFLFGAMSQEINARNMLNAARRKNTSGIAHDKAIAENFKDKYHLREAEEKYDNIVFLPGGNLFPSVSFDVLDRVMSEDESVFIKPHPITTQDNLRDIALRYGWNRILDPQISGYDLMMSSKTVFTTHASELMLLAAVLEKPVYDISQYYAGHLLTYWSVTRLLGPDIETNRTVINNIFDAPHSGLLMPWMDNVDERIDATVSELMKMRTFFKPLCPQKPLMMFKRK